MKNGRMIKRILDPLMVILLPFLMAQILTGQWLHEWLGSAMGICFILHNALNARWYKNIFKGEYTPIRTLMTAINLLLIADILAIMASGIMMSDYVFAWLGISGHLILARRLHIFAAWWGFVLMSGHLGLHWQMVMGGFRKMFKVKSESTARTLVLRALCAGLSAYGVYAFIANHISDYILLKTHFMFFDETKPAIVFLAEMSTMIVLFAAVFHYFSRGLAGPHKEKKSRDKKVWRWLAFLIPAAVIIAAIIMFNLPGSSSNAEWGGADTTTPFNMDPSPGADGCNFYGHYPYMIEENYFSQGNLITKPGEYRQTTVPLTALNRMHGGFTTCTETSANGSGTTTELISKLSRQIRQVRLQAL